MFIDMYAEVRGAVPDVPLPAAQKYVKRAWDDVRRRNLWSFQLYENKQWIAPAPIQTGTATATQGSATVTVNAAAKTAINASPTSFSQIIERQFRIAAGTIYNITAWNGTTGQLTIDPIYGEASVTGSSYNLFQCYYAAPYIDHITWVSVRDMRNFIDLFTNKTRAQINAADPQRTWYYFPTDVVYYQNNPYPASPTYKFPMFELWGSPQFSLNYQLYGIRRGAELTLPTDELPEAIGEDCLIALAKYYAYQWAEANKGAVPRNQGPDFKFLMGEVLTEYKALYQQYRKQDRELVNNWFSVRRLGLYGKVFSYYSTFSATAFPGVGWAG